MTKTERALAQQYIDECCKILRLPRVRIGFRKADRVTSDKDVLACFYLDDRGRAHILLSDAWWAADALVKRDLVAHELIHGCLSNMTRLTDTWFRAGHISAKQHNNFISREEMFVYHFQGVVAALLPEWPY